MALEHIEQTSSAAGGTAVLDSLVHNAAGLVPLLWERAEQARVLGRLTDDVVAALDEAGLVRMMAPRSRGGSQASPEAFVRVQEELARGCGSASWVCGVYAAALYMISSFTDEAQDEVFATPSPKSVAAFSPEGMATEVDGGYQLSGTWRFCSGQHHADWALLSSIAFGGNDVPAPAQFLVPRADWVSADDWQVSGLSGTGSCSLSVTDVFVPGHRVLPFADPTQVLSRSETLAPTLISGCPLSRSSSPAPPAPRSVSRAPRWSSSPSGCASAASLTPPTPGRRTPPSPTCSSIPRR